MRPTIGMIARIHPLYDVCARSREDAGRSEPPEPCSTLTHSRISEPGHGAWVIGDEPAVGFEFEPAAAETYAKG